MTTSFATAPPQPLHVVEGGLTGDAPLDTAVSRSILQRVDRGDLPETLQLGTPHPVVAFGKHDTLVDGFDAAVGIARDHGYDPTVRIAGGRAVVFSPTIIRFAWTVPAERPAPTMHDRFATLADAVVRALGAFGVEGSVGEVPNEYCAGDYSVHVHVPGMPVGRKVMGVGQRLSRSAAQVGGMVVVADPEPINDVLIPIYEALDVPLDPQATGAVSDLSEVSTGDVAAALATAIASGRPTIEATVDDETLAMAQALRRNHDPALR